MALDVPSVHAVDGPAGPGRSETQRPRLTDGVELLGEYQGSGYQEARYLVIRSDQQTLLLPPIPYLVLRHANGQRDLRQVAELVSAEHGQRLGSEGVRFLIEQKLAPLGLITLGDAVVAPPKANPLLALHVRHWVVPARFVRVIGRVLAPLHAPAVVGAVLAGLVALDCWMFSSGHADAAIRQTLVEPTFLLAMITLTLVSVFFHEFGHASACHYGGARPGAIGAGLYLFFPCFYTNVTDAYRLNRAGRLRTDLGGVYFNAVFIVVLGVAYLATGYPPLLVAAVLGHAEILQQLPPLVRMDGYYILADLVGVPNLFGHVRPILRSLLPARHRTSSRRQPIDLRPGVRRVVTAWVLLVVPLLFGGLVLMVVQLPSYVSTAWHGAVRYADMAAQAFRHQEIATALLAVFSAAMLTLPWMGMAALLGQSLWRAVPALVRLVRRRLRGEPPHRGARSPGEASASQSPTARVPG
jgi:putative peptide zinc metalloprotease protein